MHCFFSTKKKACEKRFLRGEVIFEGKTYDFSFKNNFAPIDFLLARLLSEAKNSAYHT